MANTNVVNRIPGAVSGDTVTPVQAVTSLPTSESTGLISYRTTSASNTPMAVKGSGGNIYSVAITNPNPTTVYLKLYDLASGSTTVGSSTVKRTVPCPPGTTANPGYLYIGGDNCPIFSAFSTAITAAITANLADSDNTAPSTPVSLNIIYA